MRKAHICDIIDRQAKEQNTRMGSGFMARYPLTKITGNFPMAHAVASGTSIPEVVLFPRPAETRGYKGTP